MSTHPPLRAPRDTAMVVKMPGFDRAIGDALADAFDVNAQLPADMVALLCRIDDPRRRRLQS